MGNTLPKLNIDKLSEISKEVLSNLRNKNISDDEIKSILKYILLNLDRCDFIR